MSCHFILNFEKTAELFVIRFEQVDSLALAQMTAHAHRTHHYHHPVPVVCSCPLVNAFSCKAHGRQGNQQRRLGVYPAPRQQNEEERGKVEAEDDQDPGFAPFYLYACQQRNTPWPGNRAAQA